LRVISGNKPAPKKNPVPSKLDPTLSQRMPLRMLLCDDNAINQKVAARLLQQMGYKPDIVGNGLEALAAIERQPYDLIFMDIQMPEMDGMEATRAIRQRQQDRVRHPNYKSSIVIVAMTANAMTGDREKCIAGGMDDYLSKPVRPEDVRKVIERWASTATVPDPVGPRVAQTATATASPETPAAAPAAEDSEPAVDMERLLDFTNGNPDDLRELINLYLKQTGEQITQLAKAVATGEPQEVRRLAHSCAGASATCGMSRIVPLLRELEKLGNEGRLSGAAELSARVGEEFNRIRSYLETYLQKQTALAANH
jgi:CheY-like chemotaxis protein/HPt (histidine-containing phosphotransfer) domain-containing protein